MKGKVWLENAISDYTNPKSENGGAGLFKELISY
jgi:hypothetical protein